VSEADYEKYLIRKFTHWSVYLHKNQHYIGRMYIWARRSDFTDLQDASFYEWKELREIIGLTSDALIDSFQADRINFAALGNEKHHCHVHVIPRYKSAREFGGVVFEDKRWGKNHAPYDRGFKTPKDVEMYILDMLRMELAI
jgi:diadenosine tetraphosphate (Ap4A) HIT family hydrolase